MKKFILNLLFVIGHVSRPIAIGGWMFGRFWVNHPLDYTPTWLWALTALAFLCLLERLPTVQGGWSHQYAKFWSSGENWGGH